MTQRIRKLVGTIALFLFLAIYALAVMMAAIVLQVGASRMVELAFYAIAGLSWVPPAALLISWMHRPGR